MNRSLALIPILATLVFAAPAAANTYCVNKPDCVANGGTDAGSDATALNTALGSAQGNPGKDRVEVGPGTYARAGGFSYTGGLNNALEFVGAGSGATTLANTTQGRSLQVDADGSSVEGVATVTAPSASASGLGINGNGSTAKDVTATTQAGSTSAVGIVVGQGATVTDAHVSGASPWFLYGVAGSGRLQDSSVDHANYGVYGPSEIHRVHVSNSSTGIYANGNGATTYKIDQVLIEVPATDAGIVAAPTAVKDSLAIVDHATVVGTGDKSSVGVGAQATSGGSPHNGKLVLRSSIVRGVGHMAKISASNGDASVDYDHSDVDSSTTVTDIQPGGSGAVTDKGANLNVDPQFDAAFHIGAASPVVDQGAAAVQPGESATDLGGSNRLSGAATDMGAFEYQVPPPPPPPAQPTGSPQSDPGTPPQSDSGSGASSETPAPTAGEAAAQPSSDPQILPPTQVQPITTRKRSCVRAKRSAKRTHHGRRVRKAATCVRHKRHKHRHKTH